MSILSIELTIILTISFVIFKIIQCIALYALECKINMSNKGLVFIPVYKNWVEGQIFENITDFKLLIYKICVTGVPIIALLVETVLIINGINDNIIFRIFTIIIAICETAKVILRLIICKGLDGTLILNIVFSILVADFWGLYIIKLIDDNNTAYITRKLKNYKELERIGTTVEWK